ncbi:MAG TPA: hypothetical protein VF914_17085 [Chloroflexia bacterium]|jgi:hypothetical protein
MAAGIKRPPGALPLAMRLGLMAVGIGGAADVLFHVAPAEWHMSLDGYGGAGEQAFHVVTPVGMCVTLLSGASSSSTHGHFPGRAALPTGVAL